MPGPDAQVGVSMTKVLKCGDVMPGCDFEARGATEDEVLTKAAVHAREAHGLEVTPEVAAKVKSAIREE
jgi:predicted small metal-binding protein